MKRLAEIVVFGALATVVHIAVFVDATPAGADAGGVGGDTLISLAGAAPQIVAMVESWEQPPETVQKLETISAPDLTNAAPVDLLQIETPIAPRAPVQIAPMRPSPPEKEILVDVVPPPPPAPPAPKAEPPQTSPAKVASAGRAAQRAAGTGGQKQAGQSATSQASTLSKGQAAKLQTVWGAKIRSRVERRKRFPRGASGSGRVSVLITVSTTGQLLGYKIRKSSGSAAFDKSAMQAVARAGRFPAAPKGLSAPRYSFTLPIVFSK